MAKGKTKICYKCFKIVPLRHKCPHEVHEKSHDEYRHYYKTVKWQKIREYVVKRQPICARCKELARIGKKEITALDFMYGNDRLEVHHIYKIRDREDLVYELSNLVPLCSKCHSYVDKHCESGELDFPWTPLE